MQRLIGLSLLCLTWMPAVNAQTQENTYVSRVESAPEDTAAILQLTKDFREAIINHNSKQLSTLVRNPGILFTTPFGPKDIRKVNEQIDVNFDGFEVGGFQSFSRFVRTSTKPIEERFYNIKITQDGHVGWVMFDYEFVEDQKVSNYGVETWQVAKGADDKWKIFSVVWSTHIPK